MRLVEEATPAQYAGDAGALSIESLFFLTLLFFLLRSAKTSVVSKLHKICLFFDRSVHISLMFTSSMGFSLITAGFFSHKQLKNKELTPPIFQRTGLPEFRCNIT